MCGIIGIISKDALHHMEINPEILSHRGPDSTGIWKDENKKVSLGHTRLSIIDLSDEAKQPLQSEDGRYIIVFNGEIYNYKELVKKLNARAKSIAEDTNVVDRSADQFQTQSDTEVLIECFKKWGKECLQERQVEKACELP